MDINTLRGIAVILTMFAFLSVVVWAYSGKRKATFNAAARLPFNDNDLNHNSVRGLNDD